MRCIFCGEEMSRRDKKCPACGMEVLPKKKGNKKSINILPAIGFMKACICFVLFLVVIAAVFTLIKTIKRASYIDESHTQAQIYLEEKDYGEALKYYRTTLMMYPDSTVAHDGLVEVLHIMIEEGVIEPGDKGYMFVKQYDDYLTALDIYEFRAALYPKSEQDK